MRPHVWKYNDEKKQTAHFRGYVKVYKGNVVTEIACKEVRKSKIAAMKDAKKLVIKMKNV